jgi:Zn-dependent protease
MHAEPAETTAPPSERRWAFRIGRLFGIDVFVHVTFFLILAWFGAMAYPHGGARGAGFEVLLVLLLFVCVVLHELGHALTARRFGITTRDITLYPIGGVARLQRMPSRPVEELLVAIAGPMVNLVIAAILLAFGGLRSLAFPAFDARIWETPFLGQLLLLNLALALFNLLPAFPMDGGRVLRALLAMRMDSSRATEVAARVGQVGALVFGFIGLFYNPFLVLIAIFIWFGANQEASVARVRGLLHGLPVSAAMATSFRVIEPRSTLNEAAELLLHGSQQDFPVVDDDSIVGVLSRRGLIAGLQNLGPGATVEEAMTRAFLVAHPSDLLEVVYEQLASAPCPAVPVLSGDRLVGLLTTENIGELLMVRAAVIQKPGLKRSVPG